MPKPSAGGLARRLPRATSSRGSTNSCASPSSSVSAVLVTSQVDDNFSLPAASPTTLTPEARLLEPLPDHGVTSDACSRAATPEGGRGRSSEFELIISAATARRLRRASLWGYLRAVALAARVAVLGATLAVVVAADVALAVYLFPRRETT